VRVLAVGQVEDLLEAPDVQVGEVLARSANQRAIEVS
jgi:hypothetical protein